MKPQTPPEPRKAPETPEPSEPRGPVETPPVPLKAKVKDPVDSNQHWPEQDRRTAELHEQYIRTGKVRPMALASAGIELAGIVLVMALGGWWLDGRWNTKPAMMIIGLAVGATGGIYSIWRRGKKFFGSK